MKNIYITLIIIITSFGVFSQTTVPNFSLTDTQGNEYDLYEELEKGKSVVLDFFSLQCGTCQTGIAIIENVWINAGAEGDDVWVWAIESLGGANIDIEDFITSNGGTFPGFSLSENDSLTSFFNITYTPQYFVICSDKTIKSASVENVIDLVESCQSTISIDENIENKTNEILKVRIGTDIFIDYNLTKSNTVIFEVYDLLGNKVAQKVRTVSDGKSTISFSKWNLSVGYYFVRMSIDNSFIEAERFIIR